MQTRSYPARTCTAQPKWPQVLGYSFPPSKHLACSGQPALPQCRRAPQRSRNRETTLWNLSLGTPEERDR